MLARVCWKVGSEGRRLRTRLGPSLDDVLAQGSLDPVTSRWVSRTRVGGSRWELRWVGAVAVSCVDATCGGVIAGEMVVGGCC